MKTEPSADERVIVSLKPACVLIFAVFVTLPLVVSKYIVTKVELLNSMTLSSLGGNSNIINNNFWDIASIVGALVILLAIYTVIVELTRKTFDFPDSPDKEVPGPEKIYDDDDMCWKDTLWIFFPVNFLYAFMGLVFGLATNNWEHSFNYAGIFLAYSLSFSLFVSFLAGTLLGIPFFCSHGTRIVLKK